VAIQRPARLLAGLLAVLGCLGATASGAPTQPLNPAPSSTVTASPVLSAQDVGVWLDGFMPYALRQADVAGAVVVVVKDDRVLFEKGYGYADVAARRPVDPETTLFRPGSISKLFTWTAVMQLVQSGKLDLDADVNRYLDFKIPPRDGQPVTLRELMTHTAGFEDHDKYIFGRTAAALIPLGDFERDHMPARIYPPGKLPAYSNYGAGLAGYIVQRVSGEPFEQYIERHIFAPLGMTHATFRQPLPASLAADMSTGYELGSGSGQYYEFVNPAPAGALAASGGDIARFMIAHLSDGGSGAGQILSPATARLMHARAFRTVPDLNGMALGFFEADRNGHRAIGHGGDLSFFHSDLYLLPDDHAGIYVSLNSAGADAADNAIRAQLYQQFMDRYFPAPTPSEPRWRDAVRDGRLVAGAYELSRRGQTTILAAMRLALQIKVTADANGDLSVPVLDSLTGAPRRLWREVAPLRWREVGGKSLIAAVVKDGQVQALTTDDLPAIAVLQPVPPGLNLVWLSPALAAALAVLALTVVLWPVSALVRWRYHAPFPLTGMAATLYRGVRVTAILDLLFLVGWTATLVTFGSNIPLATDSSDPWLRMLQAVGVLGLIGGAVAVWNLILVLGDSRRGWWAKLSNVAIVLALATITWVEFCIHAFNPSLNY
jgi:CubicO group peptidase (beta-lactamase class C family)